MNEKVDKAFRHVRSFFPEVQYLVVDVSGRWHWFDDEFFAPSFDGIDIDIEILQDAIDSLDGFPNIFYWPEDD